MKRRIPEYVDCDNTELLHCEFYMHKECQETCFYAMDIKYQGIGSICDSKLIKRIRENCK